MFHYLLCRSNTLVRSFSINIYRDRAKMKKNYQSVVFALHPNILESLGTASIILTYKGDQITS